MDCVFHGVSGSHERIAYGAGPQGAQFGIGKTQFGSVLAAFTGAYALMQIPGGLLADRFGLKRMSIVALLVCPIRGTVGGFVNFGGQIGGFFAPIAVGAIVQRTYSFTGGFLLMTAALVFSATSLAALQRSMPVSVRSAPA